MIWAPSTSPNYPRVSPNDRLVCNVWFQRLPEDIRGLFENATSVIYLHDKSGFHSIRKNNVYDIKKKRKRFMYLIETGFNLMPLDQPLEFFIYVNEILRVVTYCYSVVEPSYWTQRLRLPLDRILNKIINLNGKLEKELWMEQRWNSNLHQRQ